jgi:hypothetical protein
MSQSGQVRLLSAGTKDNLIVKPVHEQSKGVEIHVYGHLLSNSFLEIAIESSGKERGSRTTFSWESDDFCAVM